MVIYEPGQMQSACNGGVRITNKPSWEEEIGSLAKISLDFVNCNVDYISQTYALRDLRNPGGGCLSE
jgi:hypothetical protein